MTAKGRTSKRAVVIWFLKAAELRHQSLGCKRLFMLNFNQRVSGWSGLPLTSSHVDMCPGLFLGVHIAGGAASKQKGTSRPWSGSRSAKSFSLSLCLFLFSSLPPFLLFLHPLIHLPTCVDSLARLSSWSPGAPSSTQYGPSLPSQSVQSHQGTNNTATKLYFRAPAAALLRWFIPPAPHLGGRWDYYLHLTDEKRGLETPHHWEPRQPVPWPPYSPPGPPPQGYLQLQGFSVLGCPGGQTSGPRRGAAQGMPSGLLFLYFGERVLRDCQEAKSSHADPRPAVLSPACENLRGSLENTAMPGPSPARVEAHWSGPRSPLPVTDKEIEARRGAVANSSSKSCSGQNQAGSQMPLKAGSHPPSHLPLS